MYNTILGDIDINYLKKCNDTKDDDCIPISLNKSKAVDKLKNIIETDNNICACLVKSVCQCTTTCDCEDDIYYSILKSKMDSTKIQLYFKENIDLIKKDYYIKIFTYDTTDSEIHIMHINPDAQCIKIMSNEMLKTFITLDTEKISCSKNKLSIIFK